MEILLAIIVFGLAMAGMGIGVILSDRTLRGSCGGADHVGPGGESLSCGGCAKQQADLCPSDDPLVRLAQISHPDPRHHH
jgi:hypothetical protein